MYKITLEKTLKHGTTKLVHLTRPRTMFDYEYTNDRTTCCQRVLRLCNSLFRRIWTNLLVLYLFSNRLIVPPPQSHHTTYNTLCITPLSVRLRSHINSQKELVVGYIPFVCTIRTLNILSSFTIPHWHARDTTPSSQFMAARRKLDMLESTIDGQRYSRSRNEDPPTIKPIQSTLRKFRPI